jgi:hypothetical protein
MAMYQRVKVLVVFHNIVMGNVSYQVAILYACVILSPPG